MSQHKEYWKFLGLFTVGYLFFVWFVEDGISSSHIMVLCLIVIPLFLFGLSKRE